MKAVVINHARSCMGRVFSDVYVSVCFSHNISKTNAARITKRDTEVFHDDSWKPIYFGVKRLTVQSRGTKNKSASVFRQKTILPLVAYISYARFSLMQCSTTQAMLATSGFPCVSFCGWWCSDCRFFHAWSFCSQPAAKNIASVGHDTLVSAGFF